MNKEEKEAVKYLKENFRDYYEKEKIYLSDFNGDIIAYNKALKYNKELKNKFDIVINLVEKQNKKIKELKEEIIKKDERIDKAIKYMESWGEEPDYRMEIQMKQDIYFQELLKIIKGESGK